MATVTPEQEAAATAVDAMAAVMAKRKLTRVVVDNVTLEMSPLGFEMPETGEHIPPQVGAEHGNPTAEELLLWSAGGPLPEIKAKPPEAEP